MDYRPILCAVLCLCIGRSAGKIIDIQYREPEGKPSFIGIPDRFKPFFSFQYSTGNKVLKEGVALQIIGYVFFLLELFLFAVAAVVPAASGFAEHSEWGVIFLSLILLFVIASMGIRYNHNIQTAYDCDWITTFQRALTLLPKRRCKVVRQIDTSTYVITMGRFGRKEHYAKCEFSVTVGAYLYAQHSMESVYPFWELRTH